MIHSVTTGMILKSSVCRIFRWSQSDFSLTTMASSFP